MELPILESYHFTKNVNESAQRSSCSDYALMEMMNPRDFIDSILDSTEINEATLNEAVPLLAALVPVLRMAGPKLVSIGKSLVSSGALKNGVKAAGRTLANSPEGKNLLIAAKEAVKNAGKSFDVNALASIIAAITQGDVGSNAEKATQDQNVEQLIAKLLKIGQNDSQQSTQQQANAAE